MFLPIGPGLRGDRLFRFQLLAAIARALGLGLCSGDLGRQDRTLQWSALRVNKIAIVELIIVCSSLSYFVGVALIAAVELIVLRRWELF